MRNFGRHYQFKFFEVNDSNNIINQNEVIQDSLNFKFSYNLIPCSFNTGKFYIYNITEKSVGFFSSKNKRKGFFLYCCYDNINNLPNSLIFRGLTNRVNNYREGPDLITEIDASDVFFNITQAKIKTLNFPSGTTPSDILQKISDYLGVFSAVSGTEFLTKTVYNHPLTFSNIDVGTIIADIAADGGCAWSCDTQGIKLTPLQNNPLSTLIDVEPTAVISRNTGLIGNVRAEVISVQSFPVDYYATQILVDNSPFVTATVLMRSFSLRQTVQLICEIKSLNGLYIIYSISYNGEYRGNDWYATLKLQPLGQ